MGKITKLEKQEREKLKAMADTYPVHRAYILMVALCRPIETVRAVRGWVENMR